MTELSLGPTERITIVSRAPEVLVAEVSYGPDGSPPPAHFHPAQDERFEILEGELTVRMGGETKVLAVGDSIEIPRGSGHQFWNAGSAPARATWETRPAGRTEEWWTAVDGLGAADGRPGLLSLAPLVHEYRDVFRLSGPQPVVGPAIGALGLVGRVLGRGR
jgi:mannose-6-phosphate isomerase-like protein (cupin superfamily)